MLYSPATQLFTVTHAKHRTVLVQKTRRQNPVGILTLSRYSASREIPALENLSYSLSISGTLNQSTAICVLIMKLKISIVDQP